MRKYIFCFLLCLPLILSAQISGTITLDENAISFQKEMAFDRLIGNFDYAEEIGKPEIPILRKSFVIPENAKVSAIQKNVLNRRKINKSVYLFPVQPPVPTNAITSPDFVYPDSSVYSVNTPYPNKIVEMISDSYIQGYHVITIDFYPVEYLPLDREIYLYDISYTINYELQTQTDGNTGQRKQSLHRSELAKSLVKSLVNNPEDVTNCMPASNVIMHESTNLNRENNPRLRSFGVMDELVPDYIVITNEELKPQFQRLVDWKIKKGIPSIIETTENIHNNYPGSDLTEKIRNYLKDVKQKWGDGLFILLGGDHTIIPARIVMYRELLKPADVYFVTSESLNWTPHDQIIPDNISVSKSSFYLGRASTENISETQIFIDKVLAYEKMSSGIDSTYVNNILAADAFIKKDNSNILSEGGMSSINRYFIDKPNINKWFQFDHFNCNCEFHGKYSYDSTHGEELNKINFISALNNGGNSGLNHFHIVYHMDHSNPQGMGTSQKDKGEVIYNTDVDNLQNGKYYQIILTSGCEPADFAKDCIAEHFLTKDNGGAVAVMGNTHSGFSDEHLQCRYLLDALYKNKTQRYDLGYIFNNACKGYNPSFSQWRLHLLGDPEMPVWTATPQRLNISLTPDTIVSGVNAITVKINNLPAGQEARICLRKGEEGYAVLTVDDTHPHTFTFTPRTSGTVDVTITSHNFIPYETTIPVIADENPAIYISNLTFDDGQTEGIGSKDKQPDAGETIVLSVELKNSGNTPVDSVTAKLICTSPYINLIKDNITFDSIASLSSKSATEKFKFTIDKNAPTILKDDPEAVKFYLDIQGKEFHSSDDFKIDIYTPKLKLDGQKIISTGNGDLIPQAGENVMFRINLRNTDIADATGVKAVLSGNNSYIATCQEVPRSYAVIHKNESKTDPRPFAFQISKDYIPGKALDFRLDVTNEYGKSWTFYFNLLDHPEKVTGCSSIPYENDIEIYWNAKSNVAGYNIYKSNTENGEYVKLNNFLLPSPYYRDKNLEVYTKYFYKVTAVSQTGNESDLSDVLAAYTSCATIERFPVILAGNDDVLNRSAVNTADVDYDGKKEIFATDTFWDHTGGRIIGLKSDGSELFNTDNNITTTNQFAPLDYWSEALPAIGDLFGDGEQYVLVPTRNITPQEDLNILSCYSVKDRDGDNKPDLVWKKIIPFPVYRGVVLSNLDNSNDRTMEIILNTPDYTRPLLILDCNGNELYRFGIGNAYSSLAVADLDGDGDKEIIAGYESGLHIWHHNGKPYTHNPFKTKEGYFFNSSPVVCDLDNDGQKEILIAVRKQSGSGDSRESIIYALKQDGTLVQGWNETQSILYQNNWHCNEISVGDINGDGKLEVVALGMKIVKAWKNDGTLLFTKSIPELIPVKITPILADVDKDSTDCEIVFGGEGECRKIFALKNDGTDVKGFPLRIENRMEASCCISDIDGDGKNELIAADSRGRINAWKTLGSASRIEWGSERFNSQNTGEYDNSCPKRTVIRSDTIWDSDKEICGDILIASGTLNIRKGCNLSMSDFSLLIVRSGATLKLEGGTITNANIKVCKGAKILLEQNAQIELMKKGNLMLMKGAEMEYLYGTVAPAD